MAQAPTLDKGAGAPTPSAGAEPTPLTGAKLLLAGFVLALANFVVILDITIANVSVPHISGSLAVSPTQGTWVITSYAVAEAICVPLTGWLAARFGAVKVFLIGMAGFGFFSFMCGVAPNLGTLLFFRVCQGLCGGPIMPMSQTLILRVFPRDKVPMGMAMWAMTVVVAPIAGPILGGLISDNWSWPWIFFINLPVVAIAMVAVWRMIMPFETKTAKSPIDFVGLVLLVMWVGALQIMIDKGREEDWFASSFIVTLAVVAAIGFVAFLIWELTDDHPIVDLKILRHRGFTAGVLTVAATFGAYFASVVLVPLYLQTNLNYTATLAGFATGVTGILAVMISPFVAKLIPIMDVRKLVSFGILWLGATTLMRTGWASQMEFWQIALPQFLQGLGTPFFFVGATTIALGAVLPQETASAAGLMNFLRTFAGAVATSVATTAWEHQTRTARSELVSSLNNQEGAVAIWQGGGLSYEQARAALDRTVEMEAVTIATNHIFWFCAIIFVGAAALIWLAPRPRPGAGQGGGGH